MFTLIISGRIPSKKNSRNIFWRNGKQYNLPNKEHEDWFKKASLQLMGQDNWKRNLKRVAKVTLDFYFPDARGCDLTNKADSVMDLLVRNWILKDDKWQVTGPVLLNPCGIDRANPRCVIHIDDSVPVDDLFDGKELCYEQHSRKVS